MVCPIPESCATLRALMSVTPNLCCDGTEPGSMHSPDKVMKSVLKLIVVMVE